MEPESSTYDTYTIVFWCFPGVSLHQAVGPPAFTDLCFFCSLDTATPPDRHQLQRRVVRPLGRQDRPQKTRAISARPRSQLYVSVMVSETCT